MLALIVLLLAVVACDGQEEAPEDGATLAPARPTAISATADSLAPKSTPTSTAPATPLPTKTAVAPKDPNSIPTSTSPATLEAEPTPEGYIA